MRGVLRNDRRANDRRANDRRVIGGSAIVALTVVALTLLAPHGLAARHPPPAPTHLRLVQRIPLPGVTGRLDHLALDETGRRLFVAALGHNSVEVIDLRAGRRASSLTGFHAPQGVCFVAETGRLFVSNGGSGTVDMLDGASLRRLRAVDFHGDADNLRYDARTRRVWVGYGEGAVGVMDAATGDTLPGFELSGHPEAFEMEAAGPRLFVNVPDAAQVAVLDREAHRINAIWICAPYGRNFAMARDEAHGRLFLACRQPTVVLALDARSGDHRGTVHISGDADDLPLDVRRHRLYAVCGAGFIDVLDIGRSGGLTRAAVIPTAFGARTALYAPGLDRLYLAVPRVGAQRAEIRVYAPMD